MNSRISEESLSRDHTGPDGQLYADTDLLVPPEHGLGLSLTMSVALQAAAVAGLEIKSGWRRPTREVHEKGIGDLVTETDTRADEAACGILRAATPEIPILSEELNPDATDLDGPLWIVDPLDATTAFAFRAGPEYPATMVAYRESNVTKSAVVLFPLTNEWFYAERGVGAFKNGSPLAVPSEDVNLQSAWVDLNQFGDSAFESEEFARLRANLRGPDGARSGLVTTSVPHSGIALRIMEGVISAVVHDFNPRKMKQAPWDLVAPQLIVEESGGVFVNLQMERVDIFHPGIVVVARSKTLAESIIELTR